MLGLLTSGSRWRPRLTTVRLAIRRAAVSVATLVGPDEIVLAAALVLIAAGMWQLWRPGACLVPGCVLLWIGLPERAPFVSRQPAIEPTRGKPERRSA